MKMYQNKITIFNLKNFFRKSYRNQNFFFKVTLKESNKYASNISLKFLLLKLKARIMDYKTNLIFRTYLTSGRTNAIK